MGESPDFDIVKKEGLQEFVFAKPGLRRKYNENYHHNEITFKLPYFDDETFIKMCYTKNLIVDSSDTSFCAKCVNENRVVEIETSKRLSPSLLLLQPSVVSVGIISVFKNEAQVIYEWLLHPSFWIECETFDLDSLVLDGLYQRLNDAVGGAGTSLQPAAQ